MLLKHRQADIQDMHLGCCLEFLQIQAREAALYLPRLAVQEDIQRVRVQGICKFPVGHPLFPALPAMALSWVGLQDDAKSLMNLR